MAQGHERHEPARSPDELEQRQRPDGTFEDEPATAEEDEPLTPDVLEQRQRADGNPEAPTALDEATGEPLSPDMIEQRQTVEEDDEDGREDE